MFTFWLLLCFVCVMLLRVLMRFLELREGFRKNIARIETLTQKMRERVERIEELERKIKVEGEN